MSRSSQKWRTQCALLAIFGSALLVAAACPSWREASGRDSARAPAELPGSGECSVLVHEEHGFRYEYHVPTGHAALYESSDRMGRVDVARDHDAEAAACRRVLEARYGVARLEDLRVRYADTIRRLQALGYL